MYPVVKRKDLVYPELSYQVLGILFDVWSKVGHGHRERFYQRAVAHGLQTNNLVFSEQVPVKLYYQEKVIGTYYFDFLVDDKIVLELKVREFFSRQDIQQLYEYLRARDVKLGLLVHFTKRGVKYKRVVNVV